jgi:hypothetical protein
MCLAIIRRLPDMAQVQHVAVEANETAHGVRRVLTAGMTAAKAPHIGSGLCVSEL